ncbi:MAG: CTP synthase [Clostridiales bacterium]|nr:CTP synthase [Clostridiales bacterium]
MKYIFVTGGVVSGLGKGICAASLGRLLKQCGLRVRNQKFDPYLNVDPGTMSPYQHGEVFVTDDGAETDLDLGHYERFVDEALDANASVSSGKIYWSVLNRERQGGYLGGTVQIIPHVTDEIKDRIYAMDDGKTDVVISEIGGTVGDIESQPFLEAIRQVAVEKGRENVVYIHVPLIVSIPGSGELKSKPTQHSVKELLSVGIQPDILVCRSDKPMTEEIRRKIALFCNVEEDCVISNVTADTLYEVPLLLEREGLCSAVCRKLKLSCGKPDMTNWAAMVERIKHPHKQVRIALVGKYTELHDAYLSVTESLFHAGTACDARVEIKWVDSAALTEKNMADTLGDCSGILIPGGFGDRGIEGMILAAKYAREQTVPYLGICLGMQIAVIEFARHVMHWTDAHSAEFSDTTQHPVIALLPEQVGITAKGGTMRLGKYPCVLSTGPKVSEAYGTQMISERHRHRYEYNNIFRAPMQTAGLASCGTSPDGSLVEVIELVNHPWFVGCQFHPEFKSRPDQAHPLFLGFVKAAIENNR